LGSTSAGRPFAALRISVCSNIHATTTRSPGRFIGPPAGAFYCPRSLQANRSTHQSLHVVMLAHYIGLYALGEGKKPAFPATPGNATTKGISHMRKGREAQHE
jgi:hypothetical protein